MRGDVVNAYVNNVKRRRFRAAAAFDDIGSLFDNGEEGVWYDPSDLSTLFQDGLLTPVVADGDPVGLMMDKSGNGRNATQGTAAARPTYRTSGGLHWLEFDGVDDRLNSLFTIAQPIDRISAMRQLSWTSGDRLIGGGNTAAAQVIQTPTTPQLGINSGAALNSVAPAVGVNFVLTERHNGASSRLALNNGAYVVGNAGTTLPGGISLGSFHTAAAWGHCRIYGVVMRAGSMDIDQIAQTRAWLAEKAGVLL